PLQGTTEGRQESWASYPPRFCAACDLGVCLSGDVLQVPVVDAPIALPIKTHPTSSLKGRTVGLLASGEALSVPDVFPERPAGVPAERKGLPEWNATSGGVPPSAAAPGGR